MKKFQGIRKVLDGINQINGLPSQADVGEEPDVNDNLQGENFTLAKVSFTFICIKVIIYSSLSLFPLFSISIWSANQ